jgi:hypothetical protein
MAANIQIKRRTAKLFGVFSTYIKQKHLTSYLNLPECLSTKAFPSGRCLPNTYLAKTPIHKGISGDLGRRLGVFRKFFFFSIPNSKPPEFSYGKPRV